jgi:hypothetical protein
VTSKRECCGATTPHPAHQPAHQPAHLAGLVVGGVVALGLQTLARPLATVLERLGAGRLITG